MPRRFDQARPFSTLAIAALGWLVLPVAIKAFLRASFFEFTAPITWTESHVRDLQEYWGLQSHSKDGLIEAGRDLARVNASYALAVQESARLQAEARRLEEELGLPAYPHYREETARVCARDFSAWWQRLTLRKGRNAGILVGAPVVFIGGVVGRVVEVHLDESVVELISSPGVRLAAFFEGENRPVSFQGGDNPWFGPALGLVEFVPLDIVLLQPGGSRRLVTSGLGGEFPPGITLGRVTKLAAGPDGLFNSGTVELDPRLSNLTEVTVLVADNSR